MVLIIVLSFFIFSCGGDSSNSEDEYSWSDICTIMCEKELECFSEDWEEYNCMDMWMEEFSSEVDEGDIVETYECREAFYKFYACLKNYTCDDLSEDRDNEDEDARLCGSRMNHINVTCNGDVEVE
jgi:hypothetical protein